MRALVAVACVLLLTASTSLATTYTVRPNGTGDLPTIQAAIDACVNGDVVELTDGTFTGEGNRGMDYLGKAITVRSQSGNPEGCIIDLQYYDGFTFGLGAGPSSVLEGITLTHGAFVVEGGSPTITGCIFHDNNGGTVVLCEAPTISNCVLLDNNHSCFGMCLATVVISGGGTISNCTFARNSCNLSGGIFVEGEEVAISNCVFADGGQGMEGGASIHVWGSASVHNCTFVRNSGSGGRASGIDVHANASAVVDNCVLSFGLGLDYPAIYCEGTITLTCCDIYGNEGGDWVGFIENQYGINGNISEDPLFCDMPGGDFTIHADSPCAPANPAGCDLIGALPVGCGATALKPTTWGSVKASFR